MALLPQIMHPLAIERILDKYQEAALEASGIPYMSVFSLTLTVDFNSTLNDLRHQLLAHYRSVGMDREHRERAAHFCVIHYACEAGSSGADCACGQLRRRPQVRVLGSNFDLDANGDFHELRDTVNDRTSTLLQLGLVPGHRVQVFYVLPDVIEL